VSGMVSIIMPTCAARGYIETCVKTLRERTAYRNFEIIGVDNIPAAQIAWKIWLQQNVDKVVPMPDAFNWSRFNNRGAAVAAGEYLLFLNDDMEVTQPDWLDAMLEHMQRPEVAVVGPQLLYPDGKVQHAGMFLAAPGIARHAFRFATSDEPGYFGLALTQRNVIAVTGACMLMRRTVFQALGGFDEAHEIVNNDLDFCLRAHRAGKLVVFTPHASLTHHEAISRDGLPDTFDLSHFESRWKTLFASGDPYFSPRLSRQSDDYRPDDEPVQTVYAGHPVFRHGEIKRILVVKVDHIGDFITAIPAIRRLKQIFPAAAIHVLASRAARAFAATLDCVDEFIEFEFFNPISGLGPRDISQDDYQALSEQLAPYRFDIAVDLRKHLDTRDVLRHTPARFLAGFDHMGQFPFLDVALEWEGDKNLQRKRSHVTDDLLNLVEAIGTAAAVERTRLEVAASSEDLPDFLEDDARALFAKPVVAVHPGVGNAMRQWPMEHFASLIDLLVEQNAVNAVLIGGPEEAELAAQVLDRVQHRDSVVSLVGKTPLRELPTLLSACALYVGNNSGPKHIAAALGVPTIGIHSGVVDAIEWGPIGKRAVALRRNMTCSPCYLASMEDCPRNFACMRGLEPTIVREVSEVFLARPVERHSVVPLVEPQPLTVAASVSEAVPTSPEEAVPNDAPEVAMPAAQEAKPATMRGRRASPIRNK
jgi:ADP-heptose:LPS heptosyltransferase/GT2 family glycosyltransferase